jgi:hypothetical protein
MDSDGSCSAEGGSPQRKTLDFCSQQCDAWNLGSWGSIVLENPHRYHDTCNTTTHACRFAHPPMIPSISHETGNYNTYPRLDWLIDKFNSPSSPTIKPYWLTGAVGKLNASGLLAEVNDWATASEELYVLMWKIDIEDQRRNFMMSGMTLHAVMFVQRRSMMCVSVLQAMNGGSSKISGLAAMVSLIISCDRSWVCATVSKNSMRALFSCKTGLPFRMQAMRRFRSTSVYPTLAAQTSPPARISPAQLCLMALRSNHK